MTQYCSTAQFQRPRQQQQQQQASSSPHATQRSKTPRYLFILRILVVLLMSAMLGAGSAAGGTLTRNLAGGRYFTSALRVCEKSLRLAAAWAPRGMG